jgi:hypothetical protein
MAAYELWEMRSGNLIGSFPTEQDALRVVMNTIKEYGPLNLESVVLTYETGSNSTDLAEGSALVERAMKLYMPAVDPTYPKPL